MTARAEMEKRIRDGFDDLIYTSPEKRRAYVAMLWAIYNADGGDQSARATIDRIIEEYATDFERFEVTKPVAGFFRYVKGYLDTPQNPSFDEPSHTKAEILSLVRKFLQEGRQHQVAGQLASMRNDKMRAFIIDSIATVKSEMHDVLLKGADLDAEPDIDDLDPEVRARRKEEERARRGLKNLEALEDTVEMRRPFEGARPEPPEPHKPTPRPTPKAERKPDPPEPSPTPRRAPREQARPSAPPRPARSQARPSPEPPRTVEPDREPEALPDPPPDPEPTPPVRQARPRKEPIPPSEAEPELTPQQKAQQDAFKKLHGDD